jgi:hypothetical protein
VRFTPSGVGARTASLSIGSNDPDENPLAIGLTGAGANSSGSQPDIACNPASWDFGTVQQGSYSDQIFTLSNAGSGDLSLTDVSLAGPDMMQYSIQTGIGTGVTLGPGQIWQIKIRYCPTGPGAANAVLNVFSNDPDENPLTVDLTGTGGGSGNLTTLMVSLNSGTVNDLAVMGTTLIAATEAGGVYVSTDHGNMWYPSNSGLTNSTVRCLLVNGTDLYAGTWGGGVFFSTDNGANWTPKSAGLANLYVTSLAIDPPGVLGYQRMLAGTWGGVFFSDSHANSWNDVSAGLTETHVRSVLCSGAYLYAGTINGLFRSSTLGQSWVTIHDGLTNTAVISLGRRAGQLYAGTNGGGVYFSENDGDAWDPLILNGSDFVVPDLASFETDLFAATWGMGAFCKAELAGFCVPLADLTETNIRSLAAACLDPTEGRWCMLAGTEAGNVWFLPIEGSYPIVVDGSKDLFYESLSGPEDGFLQLRSYAWNDDGAPSGDDDLSARIWTAWDPHWFYLYEEVTDDILAADANDVWQEDCLELKFDPQATDSTVNSVWDTRLTALDDATAGIKAWDDMNGVTPNAWRQWHRKTIPGGYALELAVDWRAITSNGEAVSPAEGVEFGMAINQHDNDGEGRMTAALQWAAVLMDAVWNTPKFLGTVRLLPDHKVRFIARNRMTGATNPVPYDGSAYTRTAVREIGSTPSSFGLGQNYPNPFNPSTTVTYLLPAASDVRVSVFDVAGREVAVLEQGRRQAGVHTVRFDGSGLAGGVYFCRLEAGAEVAVRKMMLLK